MSMFGPGAMPPNAAVPSGIEIATYDTHERARKTVEYLGQEEFDVKKLSIIGKDLLIVERITGKLSLPRAALSGAIGGAWFGLFIGLVLGLMGGSDVMMSLPAAIALGVGFGMVFSVVAFTVNRRRSAGVTSAKQVVAQSYAVLCDPHHAGQARTLLSRMHLSS